MKTILHKVKRAYQRNYFRIIKKLDPKFSQKPGEFDLRLFKICMAMMNHPSTKFVASQTFDRRYLVNEDERIIVIIQDNEISITNHQYRYSISVYSKYMLSIKKEFDRKLISTANFLEDSVFDNIKTSLDTISQKLKVNA